MKYAWASVAIASFGVNGYNGFEEFYLTNQMTLLSEIDFALEAADQLEQEI